MKIEKYEFGEIIIEGKKYTRDLIIFPDKIKENWWRKEGHSLCMEDLKEILEYKPEILIIGTGYSGVMKVPEKIIKELEKEGIRVIIETTKEAVKIFNEYVEQNKKVVCALHLTC
ncbi:MAG: Mth938-like domain-containing protein [Candidatus Hydrothermales bacterium]